MSKDITTRIAPDGLRYTSKRTGSPFGSSCSPSTRSCFYCGVHRAADQRKTFRFGNRQEVICDPPCESNPARKKSA